jgi:ribonuclease Z
MRLTLLGTGSPEPYARRASSGYVIEAEGENLMFDCGGGSFGRLIESGRKPEDIDRLFFSHLHSDHMMDFARLVHARWDMGKPVLPVFGPTPIAAISGKLFGSDGVFVTDLVARTENPASQEIWCDRGGKLPRPWPSPAITEVEPGFSLDGKGWKLRSVEVPHVQPYLISMGFRIDADGKSVVYSGDSGPCDALTDLAAGADVLVHMCFQPSNEIRGPEWLRGSSGHIEVARTAEAAKAKKTVLTHLRPSMDAPGEHERMISEMRDIYHGEIVVGEDLMIFDL